MASLEKRGDSFRVIFRYGGIKYSRSLETRNEKTAQAALARLEDNLHRLQIGTLEVPTQGDLAAFLILGGGHQTAILPTAAATQSQATSAVTLADHFTQFWANLPEESLEKSTIAGMKIHLAWRGT